MGARSSVPPRAWSSARLGWTKGTLRRYQFKFLNKTGEAPLTYIVFMNSSVGFRWYIIQSIILLYIEYRFELRLLKGTTVFYRGISHLEHLPYMAFPTSVPVASGSLQATKNIGVGDRLEKVLILIY
jgi:hypothetical protein